MLSVKSSSLDVRSQALRELTRFLTEQIIGQENALGRIGSAVQAAELGLNEVAARPRASFLFLGPTGVGKTESAKVFTQFLFGSKAHLEILFMNEYAADERLTEFFERLEAAVRRLVNGGTLLFDEIEKAHPRLIDLFLSLLEEGEFTTLTGERLKLRHLYVVLTSNLGSGDLAKMENAPYSTMERVALDVASQTLRPELFARITERIVFRPLALETQRVIIESLVVKKLKLLSDFFGQDLTIDRGPVLAYLLRKGFNRAQGARLLRQEVDRQFNAASLPWALQGQSPRHGLYQFDATAGALVLV